MFYGIFSILGLRKWECEWYILGCLCTVVCYCCLLMSLFTNIMDYALLSLIPVVCYLLYKKLFNWLWSVHYIHCRRNNSGVTDVLQIDISCFIDFFFLVRIWVSWAIKCSILTLLISWCSFWTLHLNYLTSYNYRETCPLILN